MDPNVLKSDHAPSRSTIIDLALQIGLIGLLVYACSRFISPFIDLLLWSAILAVMLYPLHLRLAARLGNRWSALLIGLVGVTVMLVAMVTVVTSLASSLYSLVTGLHNHSLTVPPPPPWLAGLPLVGRKLAEAWVLAATNLPAAFAKYREVLSEPSGTARVVCRWPSRRPAIVRSLLRDCRRPRRLRQGRRRFRSASAGTFYRQRGCRGPIW